MAPSLTIHCSVTEHREYRDLDDRESSSSGDRSTVVDMTTTVETLTCPPEGHDLVLRSAASAYLGRYTGLDSHRVRPAIPGLVTRWMGHPDAASRGRFRGRTSRWRRSGDLNQNI